MNVRNSINLKGVKKSTFELNRRRFLGLASGAGIAAGVGAVFGTPATLFPQEKKKPEKAKTNFDSVKNAPRTKHSLPGPFPGKVVEIENTKVWKGEKVDKEVVREMVRRGMYELTGKKGSAAWRLFVEPKDIIGLKPNPVGKEISGTRPELAEVIIEELVKAGIPKKNVIIWDRFDYMLTDGGFTKERFPDVELVGIQTMDPTMKGKWKDEKGEHVSKGNFDMKNYYWANVKGPDDPNYLNQHVFNGEYSYFGKLISQRLTKIINLPILKNTGNSVSMATKNISFAVIANTNRLHRPIGLNLNAEVLGFPVVRDKLVLNILDGIKGQYEGGPMPNEKFAYKASKLYFATDPFAQDWIGYLEMLKKRKADKSIKVNDSPRYMEYVRYAEKLGLGIGDPKKIKHKKIVLG
jgi:hypothetical protein